jgi:hypothetical protein
MRYQCKQCLAMTDLPPGTDPHSRTWCGCCTITGEDGRPHHHGRAAASCPGDNGIGHPGEPCNHPNPKVCMVVSWPIPPADGESIPPGTAGIRGAGEPCPGGHCGAGVSGCAVCRPVIHFPVAGDPLAVI